MFAKDGTLFVTLGDRGALPGRLARVLPDGPELLGYARDRLALGVEGGRVRVAGTAANVPLGKIPTKRSASAEDATGDGGTPVTDLSSMSVRTDERFVRATMSVGQLAPTAVPGSVTAYSLLIDGRRFDSFIDTGDTSGTPVVMDNGTGYYMPAGTASWTDELLELVACQTRPAWLVACQTRLQRLQRARWTTRVGATSYGSP